MPFEWSRLMSDWSSLITTNKDPPLPKSELMVQEPVSEEDITNLEQRLQILLPPSYRAFLVFSNGWNGYVATHIGNLWPANQVNWFRERHQDWIDEWLAGERYSEQLYGSIEPMDDDDYLAYSNSATFDIRSEYLPELLEISAEHDGAILLLNPRIINQAGEWEAWFFANWLPGARRYSSFWDLMYSEYILLREQLS